MRLRGGRVRRATAATGFRHPAQVVAVGFATAVVVASGPAVRAGGDRIR